MLSSAANLTTVNHDSSIRIFHVLQGAFCETAGLQFPNRIAIRNPAEFVESSGGTPPTTIDSVFERNIEGGAINARLPARNNFECLHCSDGL